jgi:hypothetical protein
MTMITNDYKQLFFKLSIQLFIVSVLLSEISAFALLESACHRTATTRQSNRHPSTLVSTPIQNHRDFQERRSKTTLAAIVVSQQEAQKGIDIVVAALRKDKAANSEMGRLQKVNNVLGFGSPKPGTLLLRFNASFQKNGFGRSSIPMPFGLGQTNKSEGRGTMVGQVKAQVTNGKVTSCSVFRDLGYGRSFNLKC